MVTDLTVPMKQAQFGALVGISQQAVSDLVRRKVLADGAAGDEWLLAYCDHLREVAAGRGGESSQELAAERARLAREQADKIAMQNAVTRGELAPARVIEEVLAKAGSRTSRILDTIPGEVRRRMPALGSEEIAALTRIVAKARNAAARLSLGDLVRDDDDQDADRADDALPDDQEQAA